MTAATPRITFLVLCYNYGRFLPDCLQSIFAQSRQESFEIVAIDDGSTDNTQQVLVSYADQRLRVVTHERNEGPQRTFNEGLRESRGNLIARIDPDNRYHPNFLAATLPPLEDHPDVGLVYGNFNMIGERGQIYAEHATTIHGSNPFDGNEFVELLKRNFVCAPTSIARREAWLQAYPLPEWLAFGDWYFSLHISRMWSLAYVPEVVADYRIHSANQHTMIARKKLEEPSVIWLLDSVFADREQSADLEREKQGAKRAVYASHYADFALKYFGANLYADARRCYLRAISYHPTLILRPRVIRYLMATFIGSQRYNALKAQARSTREIVRRFAAQAHGHAHSSD